mmetsp:Transcript_19616/g.45663  ORF Transcript_19616/g.45663 Transcript_19616/m.45663 type:complete len:605 (+) Transcript_19616:112-1926(+)
MGRITHASPIESIYDVGSCCAAPLMVRNTFLEFKDMEAPMQTQLTRARTAPDGDAGASSRREAVDCCACAASALPEKDELSCASTASSPPADDAMPLEQSMPSPLSLLLPASGTSSFSSMFEEGTSSAEPCGSVEPPEMSSAPQVRIRNTFIEMFMPPPEKPAFKRSQSMPLSTTDSDDDESTEEEEFATSTPLADDAPTSTSFFGEASETGTKSAPVCLMPVSVPVWMVPNTAQSSSASSAPVQPLRSQPVPPALKKELLPQQEERPSSSSRTPPLPAASSSQLPKAAKQVSARGVASAADADAAAKRRPVPTASETRAQDLISDACKASHEHRNSSVWPLSRKDAVSSALVQKAIEIVAEDLEEAREQDDEQVWNNATFRMEALISGLHGHIHTAIEHPHANYVVQKVVDLLPTESVAFVVSELKGKSVWASKHRFGCRTMLRVVRHSAEAGWAGEAAADLVDELLPHASELACDKFGNYVMQEVLEHGLPRQAKRLAETLLPEAAVTSSTQHGSRVVEKALRLCGAPEVQALADELLRDPALVQEMVASEYGCFVLRALVKSEPHGKRTSSFLRPFHAELRKTRQGRRLLGPVFGNSQSRW